MLATFKTQIVTVIVNKQQCVHYCNPPEGSNARGMECYTAVFPHPLIVNDTVRLAIEQVYCVR